MQRRNFVGAAAALCATQLVRANQRFPERPLKMVVPFAPGGGTDIVARLIAAEMSTVLGQALVIDNRAGAGGSLGSDVVAKAPPEGYTILMATVSTHAINLSLYPKLPYDPVRSFEPISLVARVGGVVVVRSSSPFNSLKQLADAMRSQPGRLTFGSQGVGGISHLMGEMFNAQAGVKSTHVPYKGAAPALQDLLAGNIDIVYDTVPALLPHIQSGKLRALAVTTQARLKSLPSTPTAAEAGYPGFLAETWNALFAPARTPPQIVRQLSEAATTAVKSQSVRERMQELSAEPVGSSPAELAQFLNDEIKRLGPVIQASGAKAE